MGDDTRPIRLVYCDDDGMLRMDEEAVSNLELVKGPIGVISVCGPWQQGKSYISNQLLGISSGFKVAMAPLPSDRTTKGLWMWIDPSKKTADDGTEYSILVIDTEAFDLCRHKEKYFYLAVVLSSMLIYNQMGLINDASFRYLSGVTKMADIKGQCSPIFVWLLRDFYLSLGDCQPSQYVESSLEPYDGPVENDDVRENIEVQNAMKAVFPEMQCFFLTRPFHDLKQLKALDTIPVESLSRSFNEGVDKLRTFVMGQTKPKKIGTAVMTGPIFAQITRYMLKAFNRGERPSVASILKDVQNALESDTLVANPPAANTQQRNKKRKRSGSKMEDGCTSVKEKKKLSMLVLQAGNTNA